MKDLFYTYDDIDQENIDIRERLKEAEKWTNDMDSLSIEENSSDDIYDINNEEKH